MTLTLSFLGILNAGQIIPPDGQSAPQAPYQASFVNETYLNRLAIAPACREDIDVSTPENSAAIILAEKTFKILPGLSQVTKWSDVPNNSLDAASFLLKLIILRVDNPNVVEKAALEYNQLMASDAKAFKQGLPGLPRKYQLIVYDEIKSLRKQIAEDEDHLSLVNLALKSFLGNRKPFPETLVGLTGPEKDYFLSMKLEFSVVRCRMIKNEQRLNSLQRKSL